MCVCVCVCICVKILGGRLYNILMYNCFIKIICQYICSIIKIGHVSCIDILIGDML